MLASSAANGELDLFPRGRSWDPVGKRWNIQRHRVVAILKNAFVGERIFTIHRTQWLCSMLSSDAAFQHVQTKYGTMRCY